MKIVNGLWSLTVFAKRPHRNVQLGLNTPLNFFVKAACNVLRSATFLTLSWRSSHHIETSPLICSAYQWTGFYMIGTSAMKEVKARFLSAKVFGSSRESYQIRTLRQSLRRSWITNSSTRHKIIKHLCDSCVAVTVLKVLKISKRLVCFYENVKKTWIFSDETWQFTSLSSSKAKFMIGLFEKAKN